MTKFEHDAIAQTVFIVAQQLNCTPLEAVTLMQSTAARHQNEALLEKLIEYKRPLVAEELAK